MIFIRKRVWPKGYLADHKLERSKSLREITKILAKTKLLSIVSDDLRHILGNDATRRGIFEVFNLFQHMPLNKRFLHVLAENFFSNFFYSGSTMDLSFHPQISLKISSNNLSPQLNTRNNNILNNPLVQVIRSHLSRSPRVKQEWKVNDKNSKDGSPPIICLTTTRNSTGELLSVQAATKSRSFGSD